MRIAWAPWVWLGAAAGALLFDSRLEKRVYTELSGRPAVVERGDEEGPLPMQKSAHEVLVKSGAPPARLIFLTESGFGRIQQWRVSASLAPPEGGRGFRVEVEEFRRKSQGAPLLAIAVMDVDLDGWAEILWRQARTEYHPESIEGHDEFLRTEVSDLHIARLGPDGGAPWYGRLWASLLEAVIGRKLAVYVRPWGLLTWIAAPLFALLFVAMVLLDMLASVAPPPADSGAGRLMATFVCSVLPMWPHLSWFPLMSAACLILAYASAPAPIPRGNREDPRRRDNRA